MSVVCHLRSAVAVVCGAACLVLTIGATSAGCQSSESPAGYRDPAPRRGAADGAPPLHESDAPLANDGGPGTADGSGGGQGEGAGVAPDGPAENPSAPSNDAAPIGEQAILDLSSNRLESIVVAPNRADPDILLSSPAEQQYGLWDTRVKAQRHRLVVLIPSEGADPAAQVALGEIVAGYGFHVVLPGYANKGLLFPCIGGPRCSSAALHLERLEATDSSDQLIVSPPDGLERRIARTLRYLAQVNPAGDWGFYLSGELPRWERIVVGGFSAGGTMAAFTALRRPVSRVVMLGGPWAPDADWVTIAKTRTPAEAFYGFVHQRADRYGEITLEWMALGLVPLGPLTAVDGAVAPYGQSHRLHSNASVGSELCPHFSVAPGDCSPRGNGTYLFAPVWRYLFTGE